MTLKEILDKVGENMVKDMKAILTQKKKNASNTLRNSLKAYTVGEDADVSLGISMVSYGRWVDQGRRKGTMPPVDPIKRWCRIRGIDMKYAFVIAKAIMKRGIRPTYFYTSVMEEYTEDVDKYIDQYVNGIMTDLDKDLKELEMMGF